MINVHSNFILFRRYGYSTTSGGSGVTYSVITSLEAFRNAISCIKALSTKNKTALTEKNYSSLTYSDRISSLSNILSFFDKPKLRSSFGNTVNSGQGNYLIFNGLKILKFYSNFGSNITIFSASMTQTVTEAFFVTNTTYTHDFLALLSNTGNNYTLRYYRNATILA